MLEIRWCAKYSDGTVVNQYDAEGKERSYEQLDHASVVAFGLYDQESRRPLLTLHLDPGQRLIYRRRVEMKQTGDRAAAVNEVCYLVGWRRTVAGECIQSIAYVFASTGRIEMAGKFDERHAWFYSPTLRPFEE